MKIRIYWKRTDWTISLSVRFRPSISPILPEALMELEAVDQSFSPLGVQSEGESLKGHNEPDPGEDPIFFIGTNLSYCIDCVVGRIHEAKVLPIDFLVLRGQEEGEVGIEDDVVGQVQGAFIFIENVF